MSGILKRNRIDGLSISNLVACYVESMPASLQPDPARGDTRRLTTSDAKGDPTPPKKQNAAHEMPKAKSKAKSQPRYHPMFRQSGGFPRRRPVRGRLLLWEFWSRQGKNDRQSPVIKDIIVVGHASLPWSYSSFATISFPSFSISCRPGVDLFLCSASTSIASSFILSFSQSPVLGLHFSS